MIVFLLVGADTDSINTVAGNRCPTYKNNLFIGFWAIFFDIKLYTIFLNL